MKHSKAVEFSRQKAVLSFLCLFVGWIFFFWPTLVSIFEIKKALWLTLSTYSVALVSLYFIIARMKLIETTAFVSSQFGLLTLFLMVTFFILGEITNISYAEQSSVMLMFPALVLTAFGPFLVQKLLFPLLYLMFVIPLQDQALESRPMILLAAILVLIGYIAYQKISKLKEAGDGTFTHKTSTLISLDSRWLMPTFVAFSMLMVAPWLGDNIRSFYPVKQREIALMAPLGTDGWTGPYPVRGQAWTPQYKSASATLEGEYFRDAGGRGGVYLYSAYFHSDRDFNDLLDNSNSLYDASIWKKMGVGSSVVSLNEDQILNVLETTLQSGGVSRLVWYWYYVAGVSTTDLILADFLDKVRLISKHAQGSGIIAISTTYANDPTEARERLKLFLNAMYPGLGVLKRPEIL